MAKSKKNTKTLKKTSKCPAGSHRSGNRCMSTKSKCPKGSKRNSKTGKCTRKK
jgi:hypothetical protein